MDRDRIPSIASIGKEVEWVVAYLRPPSDTDCFGVSDRLA